MTLTMQQQQLVEQRLTNEAKSTGLSYALWFFLGGIGAHRFYLGKTGSAIAMLALFVIGWLTTVILIGWLVLLVFGIWWIVDAFLIPGMVDADRHAKRLSIANEIDASVSKEIV